MMPTFVQNQRVRVKSTRDVGTVSFIGSVDELEGELEHDERIEFADQDVVAVRLDRGTERYFGEDDLNR